jgi:hypothetical protein
LKPAARLRDIDAADRVVLLKAAVWFGPACVVILSILGVFLWKRGVIPAWFLGVWIALTVPAAAMGVLLIYHAVGGAAQGLTALLTGAGNIPPPQTYPRQEVLIARGEYREAAEFFRDHLTVAPDDHVARLRLAALLETHLRDDAGAERCYLEIRRAAPESRHAYVATNSLIDLYRRTGRRDRLIVELARFADRYRGTAAGAAAGRELAALKVSGDTPAGL